MKQLRTQSFVKAKPSKNTIRQFIKQASVSGAIWRLHEIALMSGLILKNPILDIGCGDGSFVKNIFSGKFDYGLDILENDLRKAKKIGVYKKLLLTDAHKIPLRSKSIQTIFSNSVFEHIKNFDGVLLEMSRVLKVGGILIFTTHSPSSGDFYVAKLLRSLHLYFLAKNYEGIFIRQLQLNTLMSPELWSSKLASVGLEIVTLKTIISPRSAFLYEIFQPLTFIQNRITLLKKIYLTTIILKFLGIDYYWQGKNGRNFFIMAKKVK